MEKEKGVILREMQASEGNMREFVMDHLYSVAFQGTSLGRTTLGRSQNIM